eukprot:gb/GECG01010248.1/.p1 GENE.gb/GECG01010248.1/~~gb/GECG01010248.1/.p1  ORF type:complete len:447 (+),score=45.61 gb/GECG01010248.1/:1-1341(+)
MGKERDPTAHSQHLTESERIKLREALISGSAEDIHSYLEGKTAKETNGSSATLDVNRIYYKGENTPLHVAAQYGNSVAVWTLIDGYNASLSKQNKLGDTPVHIACKRGHIAVVELLSKHCKRIVDLQGANGRTPLHIAAQDGHKKLVRLLVFTYAAFTECKDADGRTPLHLGAKNGQMSVVKILVEEAHAAIDATDQHGNPPEELAKESGHPLVTRLLRSNVTPSDDDPAPTDASCATTESAVSNQESHVLSAQSTSQSPLKLEGVAPASSRSIDTTEHKRGRPPATGRLNRGGGPPRTNPRKRNPARGSIRYMHQAVVDATEEDNVSTNNEDFYPMEVMKRGGILRIKRRRQLVFTNDYIIYKTMAGQVKGRIPVSRLQGVSERDSKGYCTILTQQFHRGGYDISTTSDEDYERLQRILNRLLRSYHHRLRIVRPSFRTTLTQPK